MCERGFKLILVFAVIAAAAAADAFLAFSNQILIDISLCRQVSVGQSRAGINVAGEKGTGGTVVEHMSIALQLAHYCLPMQKQFQLSN